MDDVTARIHEEREREREMRLGLMAKTTDGAPRNVER